MASNQKHSIERYQPREDADDEEQDLITIPDEDFIDDSYSNPLNGKRRNSG